MNNEDYMIGSYFKGLIPCWVNAPSTFQPAHKYHGKNLVVMHENAGGFRCCCVDDETPRTFHIPEDTFLVEGWKDNSGQARKTAKITKESLDFEQVLYKAFGQVKDFTLGMHIAKYFYELGLKAQKGE